MSADANGDRQVVQGIRLGKHSLVTVKDLEVALDAAVHINRLLNQELITLSEQLRSAEADKHAWQAHARRLAAQLAEHKLAASPGSSEQPYWHSSMVITHLPVVAAVWACWQLPVDARVSWSCKVWSVIAVCAMQASSSRRTAAAVQQASSS